MKISLITAVYNRESTIGFALHGIFSQNYEDIESVIIDGGSIDNTKQIISEFQKIYEKLLFISEPDEGIYDALNKGIRHSTGEIIGFAHSDDYFADSDVISNVVALFLDPSVDIVYGDLDYVDSQTGSNVIRHWVAGKFKRNSLVLGWMPPHPSMFIRRSVVHRLGAFDPKFKISADYDAILRYFSEPEINAKYIPRVLVKMRVGGESNKSISKILRKSLEDYRALRKNGCGGLPTLFAKNIRKVHQFFIKN